MGAEVSPPGLLEAGLPRKTTQSVRGDVRPVADVQDPSATRERDGFFRMHAAGFP
jgi:hypothetical protein